MNERDVCHHRYRPTQSIVNLALASGVREMIVPPDHMRYAHVMIIDDHGEHVGRCAVGAQKHEIIKVLVLPNDASLHLILNHGLARQGGFEPDHRGNAGRCLGWAAITPAAVIELCPALPARRLSHLRELFGRGVAAVSAAAREELLCDFTMTARARELVNRIAVPMETQPGQPVEDGIDGRLGRTLAVSILDTQKHFAAPPARIEPIEKCGASSADMKKTGG